MNRQRRAEQARTKASGHTGVMVALFVPASALSRVTALQEGLPNPEPAEDLHLTLAYLGKSSELAPYAALIDEVLTNTYWGDLPLSGRIGGIGRFHHDEGNGTNAVYASFDSPALPAFRQMLVDALISRRIPVVQNHGFTPHITLAYVPVDTDIPTKPRGDLPELTFGTFTLAWGDTRIEYGPGTNIARLSDGLVTKAANFGARAGERIVGNLGRGGDGKFTSAGSGGSPTSGISRAGSSAPAGPRKRRTSRPAAVAPQQQAGQQKPGKGQQAKPAKGRAAARGTATNRRRVAAELKKAGTGVGPKSMAAMEALRNLKRGEDISPAHAKTLEILKATGMVEMFEDGSFALTASGKAFLEAADRGDTKAARAAITANRPKSQPAQKSFTVFKDAAGRWRWITISSTAFRDRDGEIVSTKALADDVARADADGDYGPLRWWHTPGLDIGDCDFNAMSGRTLIESGTFRDERYGPMVAAKADELGISIGFKHAATEPDADKVFHSIRRFERSLVPLPYPSNLYTALVVKEISTVDEKKIAGLKALGFDDAMITAIQEQATAREKAGDAAGIAFKSSDVEATKEGETAAPEVAAPTAESDGPDPVFVGDLTPDEFVALLQRGNQPLIEATATKSAREQETATALKAAQDQLAATNKTIVELQATLKAEREATDAKLAQALKSIAELQGDIPAGIKRASQDPATIVGDDHALKTAKPEADSLFGDFWSNFTPGQSGQGG